MRWLVCGGRPISHHLASCQNPGQLQCRYGREWLCPSFCLSIRQTGPVRLEAATRNSRQSMRRCVEIKGWAVFKWQCNNSGYYPEYSTCQPFPALVRSKKREYDPPKAKCGGSGSHSRGGAASDTRTSWTRTTTATTKTTTTTTTTTGTSTTSTSLPSSQSPRRFNVTSNCASTRRADNAPRARKEVTRQLQWESRCAGWECYSAILRKSCQQINVFNLFLFVRVTSIHIYYNPYL